MRQRQRLIEKVIVRERYCGVLWGESKIVECWGVEYFLGQVVGEG